MNALQAAAKASVTEALETHPRHEPTKVSKSRIKRLRGVTKGRVKQVPLAEVKDDLSKYVVGRRSDDATARAVEKVVGHVGLEPTTNGLRVCL